MALTKVTGYLLGGQNRTISADTTITADLIMAPGDMFTVAANKTLTITGAFQAGLYQVFDCSATGSSVVFGSGAVSEVYPEWWGAVGDGVTDDANAIVSASNSGCKTLALTKSYNANNANITALNLTVTGGGTVNSGLLIGPSGTTPSEMHIVIKGLRFSYASLASNQPGLTFRNCRYHTVTDNVFVNCDKSILYTNINVNQHCNRGIISQNIFNNINYCVYNDVTGVSVTYLVGDITFTNNQSYARITHLYIPKQDGAIIRGNTLFFPGYQLADGTKQRHIDSVKSSMLIISGNQLFEAGLESIYLDECGITEISNNNIIWSGQRVQSYAIQIVRTGASATAQQNVMISNNNIVGASSGGIDLGTNNATGSTINYANVVNNSISMLGSEMVTPIAIYYGSTITGSLYYIACKSTNNRITYTSNRCFSSSGSVGVGSIQYPTISSSYSNTYSDNLSQEETTSNILRDKASSRQLNSTSTGVELDAAGLDVVAWSPGSATSCRSIKSGIIGNELIIYAGNANLTLVNQSGTAPSTGYSLLILKSATNVTLSAGQIVVLRFMNTTGTARWFEISRNF